MPDEDYEQGTNAEFEVAPEGVEQVLAVRTEVFDGVLDSDTNPNAKKIDVVVLALWFTGRDADPEDEPMQTLVIFPSEDARALRRQLEVADTVKTVAEQVTE